VHPLPGLFGLHAVRRTRNLCSTQLPPEDFSSSFALFCFTLFVETNSKFFPAVNCHWLVSKVSPLLRESFWATLSFFPLNNPNPSRVRGLCFEPHWVPPTAFFPRSPPPSFKTPSAPNGQLQVSFPPDPPGIPRTAIRCPFRTATRCPSFWSRFEMWETFEMDPLFLCIYLTPPYWRMPHPQPPHFAQALFSFPSDVFLRRSRFDILFS